MLLVEVAQLALGAAGLALQRAARGLRDAERRRREGEPAEQVVPVAVRREQPDDAEARLRGDRRQQLELVRQHRRVDPRTPRRPRRTSVHVVWQSREVATMTSAWRARTRTR